MHTKQSRAVIALDGNYARKCEPVFTLRPEYREPETLAEFEAALQAFNLATAMPRLRLEHRVLTLRDAEERGRALSCVAPLPLSNHE